MLNPVSKESVDLTQQNIEKLKELFPEILTDGNKINFELLQTILGEEVDGEKERYSFTWPGKRDAILGAQQPSKGTLLPNKEKSKDFDTTENLYIEGDNLEVLKLLQKSYNNKIKVIYIDPPYNTGKDFVYKDNFRDGVENYLEQTGQVDSAGNLLSTNSESNGRFHTDWLNMMYPRLKLAKNLLTDDGLIFISINDIEIANLKKMCDEIFGENNLIANFVWHSSTGGGLRSKYVNVSHQYILCYAKSLNNVPMLYAPLSEEAVKSYNNKDEKGVYRDKDFAWKNSSTNPNQIYGIEAPDGEVIYPKKGYILRFIKERFELELANNNVTFKKTTSGPFVKEDGSQANWNIYIKKYLGEAEGAPTSVLPRSLVGLNNDGTTELQNLFGERIFEFPKSVRLLKYLISIGSDKESIVLDFFSGSSTTAQTVMQLNSEDGGNRKFIMVQIPEILEKNSNGYRANYRTISEIGSDRIRLSGDLIIEKNMDLQEKIDIGFKYFELDKSNIKEWNTDFDSLEDEIDLFAEVFVEGRNELDVVYEIMLKNGLELTLPVNFIEVDGKKVYDIAFGLQFVCLADEINTRIAKAIINKRDEYGTETISGVVFKDAGFNGNDSEKLNCIQLLKDAGFIEENLQTI